MGVYAVHDGQVIVNAIIADSLEIARYVTPKELQVIETDADNMPAIGWTLEEEGWRKPSPYVSWVWDKKKKDWVAPIPPPDKENDYVWDESRQEWALVDSLVD